MKNIYKKEPEYYRIHSWLIHHYGNANHCEMCDGVKAKRFEYALKKGENHARNIENYLSLCPSCHRKYDITEQTRENLSKGITGCKRPTRWIPVVQMDENGNILCVYESVTSASQKTGIKRESIGHSINGRRKLGGGFVWAKQAELC